MKTFRFLKNYKHIKKGTLLETPSVWYSGQVNMMILSWEIEKLLKNKTIEEI